MTRIVTLRAQSIALVIAASMLSTVALAASRGSITIEREVLLAKGTGGDPQLIIRTPDDGFVVAGAANGLAWAARVDADGVVKWEYRDTVDVGPAIREPGSTFQGAIVLADNSVLLCGNKGIEKAQVGLVVRIDTAGKRVDRQYLRPNNDAKYFFTNLKKCLPWDNGFAILGDSDAGVQGGGYTGWLVKLDKDGKQMWEKTGRDYAARDVLETSNHDLVLAMLTGDSTLSMKLVRIGPSGGVLEQRVIPKSPFFFFVTSVVPRDSIMLATLDWPTTTLYTLSLAFRDVLPPKRIETIALDRAYELPDHSLAMFGRVEVSNNVTAAVIGRVSVRGKLGSVHIFEPHIESFTVKDAVPLKTPGEFVSVRGSPQNNSRRQGILMSWVTVK
jgi:hypothetical protein